MRKLNVLWSTGNNLFIFLSLQPFFLSFLRRFVEVKSNLYCQAVFLGFYALFSTSHFYKLMLLERLSFCPINGCAIITVKSVVHVQLASWWRIPEAYFHLPIYLNFILYSFPSQNKHHLLYLLLYDLSFKKYVISFQLTS